MTWLLIRELRMFVSIIQIEHFEWPVISRAWFALFSGAASLRKFRSAVMYELLRTHILIGFIDMNIWNSHQLYSLCVIWFETWLTVKRRQRTKRMKWNHFLFLFKMFRRCDGVCSSIYCVSTHLTTLVHYASTFFVCAVIERDYFVNRPCFFLPFSRFLQWIITFADVFR